MLFEGIGVQNPVCMNFDLVIGKPFWKAAVLAAKRID
jgi:hypothetical protein